MTRKMKDSGIEWIGEIPEEWEIVQLKRFATVNNGREIENEVHASEYATPVFGSGGVFKYTDSYMYDGEAVMFGRKGTLGKPIYVNKRFWTVDTMYYLTYNQSLVAKYNYYQLLVFNWESHITQTALPSIVASEIVSCRFPIPPLDEQMYISSYLDTQCAKIDAVLEQTRQSIEEYKRLKQAVITRAVTKGIRPGRKMKDSGIEWIGEVPEGWITPKMGDICMVITDYVASGSFADLAKNVAYLDDPDYAMLVRTADISDKGYNKKPVYINRHAYNYLHNSNLYGGELVFPNIGASVGDVYIVPVLYERMSLAPNAIMVKTNYIDKYYYYYFQSKPGRLEIQDIAQSTAQAKFNKTDFRQLRVLLPTVLEQQQIVQYLDKKSKEMNDIISRKQLFISELESYKKSLIYECVTGKREV